MTSIAPPTLTFYEYISTLPDQTMNIPNSQSCGIDVSYKNVQLNFFNHKRLTVEIIIISKEACRNRFQYTQEKTCFQYNRLPILSCVKFSLTLPFKSWQFPSLEEITNLAFNRESLSPSRPSYRMHEKKEESPLTSLPDYRSGWKGALSAKKKMTKISLQ